LASHSLLLRIYDKLVLTRPITALIFTFLVIGIFAFHLPQFKLDASGDSLVLENDADLRYYRRIAERYGTNEVLVLTYTPKAELFAETTLADLKELRDELQSAGGG
jgi:hypothetical protein